MAASVAAPPRRPRRRGRRLSLSRFFIVRLFLAGLEGFITEVAQLVVDTHEAVFGFVGVGLGD